jgi:tagaturonate reductase
MPALAAKLGYLDPMLVASELFHLWVIEGDPAARTELPFTQAGLNVIWAESLAPYRTLKVRVLNGLHTTFSIPAFLSGMNTVLDGLNDSLIERFIMRALNEEIIPALDVPEETAKAYAAQVLERFRNPYIKHRLLSIASNSVSKYKVRVLPTVLRFMETKRAVPPSLSLALAALISFYQGKRDSARTSFGSRLGVPYPIVDEPEVLDFFAQRDELYVNDAERLCRETLSRTAFWGLDLTRLEGFLPAVIQQFEMLESHGVRQAMRQVAGP